MNLQDTATTFEALGTRIQKARLRIGKLRRRIERMTDPPDFEQLKRVAVELAGIVDVQLDDMAGVSQDCGALVRAVSKRFGVE